MASSMVPRISVKGTYYSRDSDQWIEDPAGLSTVVLYEDTDSHSWFIMSFGENDRSHRAIVFKFIAGTTVSASNGHFPILKTVYGTFFGFNLTTVKPNLNSTFIHLLDRLQSNANLDGSNLLSNPTFLASLLKDDPLISIASEAARATAVEKLTASVIYHPSKPHLPRADLSCLIDNDSLPCQLTLQHGMSGSQWKVNSAFLMTLHPALPNTDKLRSVIKNSGLPFDSIIAFIGHLFHKKIEHTVSRTLSRHLLHSIHLSRVIGLPWEDLKSQCLSSFSDFNGEDASWSVIDAWNDEHVNWSKDEEPLNYLLTIIKRKWQQVFVGIASSIPSTRMMMLLTHVLTRPDLMIPAYSTTFRGLPVVEVEPVSTLILASPNFKVSSSEFAFLISSKNSLGGYYFKVNPFYLYPRWNYFRRMIDSKLTEATDRKFVVGPQFNVNIFKAILQCLYSEFKTPLTENEAMIVLENAYELELVNLETNQFNAPFESLLTYCFQLCFPEPCDSNLAVLLSRYHRLQAQDKVQELIGLIIDSKRSYTIKEFLTMFSMDLCQLIFDEIQLRS